MSRTLPLFKLETITQDLRVHSLSLVAQLFFIKLMALANEAGGLIALRGNNLSLEAAAKLLGIPVGADFPQICAELSALVLIEECGKSVWCIPEMVAAAELRRKRQKAGSLGGKSAQKTLLAVCSSKSNSNVVSLEERRAQRSGGTLPAKKEKRTKKEKNNKYIYIFDQKVLIDDRGTTVNPEFMIFEDFVVYKREYQAILAAFESLSDEILDDELVKHAAWLEGQSEQARENWLGCLLGLLKSKYQRAA